MAGRGTVGDILEYWVMFHTWRRLIMWNYCLIFLFCQVLSFFSHLKHILQIRWPEDFVAIHMSCLKALTFYKISQRQVSWFIYLNSECFRKLPPFCISFLPEKKKSAEFELSWHAKDNNINVIWLWNTNIPRRMRNTVIAHLFVCFCSYTKSLHWEMSSSNWDGVQLPHISG